MGERVHAIMKATAPELVPNSLGAVELHFTPPDRLIEPIAAVSTEFLMV